jgi:hypothetical protein
MKEWYSLSSLRVKKMYLSVKLFMINYSSKNIHERKHIAEL